MFALVMLVIACGPGLTAVATNDDTDLVEEEDDVAPVIEHEAISGSLPSGVDVEMTATVTDGDGSGVLFVYLWYKNETDGDADWSSISMFATGDSYSGSIPGDDQRGAGMDYYLEAFDRGQNAAYAPRRGGDDPYHFRLN